MPYTAKFENGSLNVYDGDGQMRHSQPFLPADGDVPSRAWESEEESLNWYKEHLDGIYPSKEQQTGE